MCNSVSQQARKIGIAVIASIAAFAGIVAFAGIAVFASLDVQTSLLVYIGERSELSMLRWIENFVLSRMP